MNFVYMHPFLGINYMRSSQLFESGFTGHIPLNYSSPPKPNAIYLVLVGNYARSSHKFESGFTGF
jgi:hypothetical protein